MEIWILELIVKTVLKAKYKGQLMVENDILNITVDVWGGAGPDCCTMPVLAGFQ